MRCIAALFVDGETLGSIGLVESERRRRRGGGGVDMERWRTDV